MVNRIFCIGDHIPVADHVFGALLIDPSRGEDLERAYAYTGAPRALALDLRSPLTEEQVRALTALFFQPSYLRVVHVGDKPVPLLEAYLEAQGLSDVEIHPGRFDGDIWVRNLDEATLSALGARIPQQALQAENEALRLRLRVTETELRNQQQYLDALRSDHETRQLQDYYTHEYEILPRWYKRLGQVIKVVTGKRTFSSLFRDDVKKYKT